MCLYGEYFTPIAAAAGRPDRPRSAIFSLRFYNNHNIRGRRGETRINPSVAAAVARRRTTGEKSVRAATRQSTRFVARCVPGSCQERGGVGEDPKGV